MKLKTVQPNINNTTIYMSTAKDFYAVKEGEAIAFDDKYHPTWIDATGETRAVCPRCGRDFPVSMLARKENRFLIMCDECNKAIEKHETTKVIKNSVGILEKMLQDTG